MNYHYLMLSSCETNVIPGELIRSRTVLRNDTVCC